MQMPERPPAHRFGLRRPTTPRADAYVDRLAERQQDLDKPVAQQARLAQLTAITVAGMHAPDDLSQITAPCLVVNGDHDLMVANEHSAEMAKRIPNVTVTIYPDSDSGPEVLAVVAAKYQATA